MFIIVLFSQDLGTDLAGVFFFFALKIETALVTGKEGYFIFAFGFSRHRGHIYRCWSF
jgi:hypothetical protein